MLRSLIRCLLAMGKLDVYKLMTRCIYRSYCECIRLPLSRGGKGGMVGVRKREETPKGTKEEKYEGMDDRGWRSMDGKTKG